MLKLIYDFELLDANGQPVDRWQIPNLMPQVSIDYVAASIFGDTAAIGTFYLGLYQGNFTPDADTTAADLPTTAQECVDYSEATRPIWTRTYDGVGTVGNLASRGVFTMTQNRTLYGGFLVSTSTKGSGSGLLLSITRFSSPRVVEVGQVLRVGATLTLVATEVV